VAGSQAPRRLETRPAARDNRIAFMTVSPPIVAPGIGSITRPSRRRISTLVSSVKGGPLSSTVVASGIAGIPNRWKVMSVLGVSQGVADRGAGPRR
jgi:hypothetical protein